MPKRFFFLSLFSLLIVQQALLFGLPVCFHSGRDSKPPLSLAL